MIVDASLMAFPTHPVVECISFSSFLGIKNKNNIPINSPITGDPINPISLYHQVKSCSSTIISSTTDYQYYWQKNGYE